MKAARGDVGGNEEVCLPLLQVIDDLESLLLREITNDILRLVAVFPKPIGKLFAHGLGIGEDKRRLRILFTQNPEQERHLLVL